MLSLTYESFRLLVETDPLPHAVVDMRSPASGDLKLPEETKVLKLEEYRSGMVPADGCVCIVHDADTAPSVDISDVTCVCFDSRTAPNPSGVVLESVACADIVQHATDHIVLDVRRPDEIANFGKLDFARNVPLHEMMQQLGNGQYSSELKALLEENKSGKPIAAGCRTQRRSRFCAQVLKDFGCDRVHYITMGATDCAKVEGTGVKAYPSYELGDPVPPAE